MINLWKFKEIWGEELRGLTDQEIEEIRDAQYKIVDLAFEFWQQKKLFSKS